MAADPAELERRTQLALAAILRSFGTEEGEFGATLFVSHHLEELERSYWQSHLGTEAPEPGRVLGLLQLRSHWSDGDEDGLDTLDFSLPGDVTSYVLSVGFTEDGGVEEIAMES